MTGQDIVTLQVPREQRFLPLLHMVLGGIGARRDLSYDALDDVLLAVDTVLAEDAAGEELTMRVALDADTLTISIETLSDSDLKDTLMQGQVPPGREAQCLDVCLLLRSLVDQYRVHDLDQGGYALVLQKAVR